MKPFFKQSSILKKRPYQICKRCVMDTTDPLIEFDSKGICNHCSAFLKKRYQPKVSFDEKSELDAMFQSIKDSRTKKTIYDVAIGVSGGVDSSYVLYLAQKAGLKILAIHMDNCWDTATAILNINNLISLKNVDYRCEVVNWKNFKTTQKILIESGLPDIELPTDSSIPATLHRICAKYRVKAILSGGNFSNEGILPAAWMYNPKDILFIKSIFKKARQKPYIFNSFKYGLREDCKYRFFHKIKTYYPLNTFGYDKKKAIAILKKEVHWKSHAGKHCECLYTKFAQLIYQPKRHGMDYRRAHLSTDICNQRIKRDEALAILKKPSWEGLDLENELSFIARKLDYKVSELEDIMNSPPFWYKDYSNNETLLSYIYNFYRLIKGKPIANYSWWG